VLYLAQGNSIKAEPLIQRASAIREKVLGKEHPDFAESLAVLSQLYFTQGKYAEAELLLQRSLATSEKALGREHPNVAQVLNALALSYQNQGKYSQAEPLYQRSLAISEKNQGKEHSLVAISLNNLANLYDTQGKYTQAEPLYQRSLAILEKNLGKEHPFVATSLNNLADLYKIQGNYNRAEPLYQRSLAILEKNLGREHHLVALSLYNLALLYDTQGKYAKAEPLYQRSLAISEKALGREHPNVANSLSSLAGLYFSQGKYAKAEPLYQRSLAISEKALGKEHPNVALSLNGLANLYQAQGKYTQAEPLYQRSLAIHEKALGKEHPEVANNLNNLALLYSAQNNIPRAIDFFNRGSNIEEHNLALILTTGSEAQKRAYIATLFNTISVNISLHVQAAPSNPQATRLALTTILRRKGRVLDALTDSLQALKSRLNVEDRALLDSLAKTRSQLAALTFKGTGNTPPEQFRNQITTLTEQEQTIEAAISRRSAEFRTQNQSVTIEGVQKLIPANAALVEIVLYQPVNPKALKRSYRLGKPRYVAYILQSQGEPKWVDLGDAVTINKAVSKFRNAIRTKSGSQTPFKTAARNLDTMLMQPIRKQLGNKRNILLSPDAQLNLIPFAALIDDKNQYLLENYEITYLSSGRDLIKLQANLPSKENPVIVANPQFDQPGNTPTRVASSTTRGTNNRTSADLASLKYGSIPGTVQEAKAISTILPNAKLLTGSEATENAIKQLNAPNILHIATHGFFLEDAPPMQPSKDGKEKAISLATNPLLRSGLALAGFNLRKSGNEDGVLTALEVAGLNLAGTKLVVLSACETGIGDLAYGEGVYGLRRALAIAGAESQLITLWLVDDIATRDLMMSYYQRLQKNVGRSAALRQVQLEMLKNPEYKRPYYWAAFIPSGEWSSLQVKP
jgi:CHAT domain-containing protein/Tfp pilus assembly protein PilF